MDEEYEGDNFGQRVDLATRITEIVESYTINTICKELLQNADDAGAGEVRFCLDHTQYGVEKCLEPNTTPLQGPALLVYNDAPFSDDDLCAIQKVGGATKRTDVSKTGNYGQGFNAVYHITDVPQLRSGNWIAMLDPNRSFLRTREDPGMKFDLSRSQAQAFCSKHIDSFKPLMIWGDGLGKAYQGVQYTIAPWFYVSFLLLLNAKQMGIGKLELSFAKSEQICKNRKCKCKIYKEEIPSGVSSYWLLKVSWMFSKYF